MIFFFPTLNCYFCFQCLDFITVTCHLATRDLKTYLCICAGSYIEPSIKKDAECFHKSWFILWNNSKCICTEVHAAEQLGTGSRTVL